MDMMIEQMEDGVTRVTLVGQMDLAGAQQIDTRFSAVSGGSSKVLVDLSEVGFLASMGIRTIVMGAKTISSKGGKMVLFRPNADVEKVLLSSGIDSLVPIAHDLDTAQATLFS
jgi:anti-sigma B factor antagonist